VGKSGVVTATGRVTRMIGGMPKSLCGTMPRAISTLLSASPVP
jgi:hypothetical protein